MNSSLPLPPPPPPRSPGSANSPSFTHRRGIPPQSITTTLGYGGGGQTASPYSYTPTASANSPYASANYSPSAFVSPTNAHSGAIPHTESPRILRSPSAGMEYNPQQWSSQPTGIQFRARGVGGASGLTIPTGRGVALDESGRELYFLPFAAGGIEEKEVLGKS